MDNIYRKITNPVTNKSVSIINSEGISIINKYLSQINQLKGGMVGGESDAAKKAAADAARGERLRKRNEATAEKIKVTAEAERIEAIAKLKVVAADAAAAVADATIITRAEYGDVVTSLRRSTRKRSTPSTYNEDLGWSSGSAGEAADLAGRTHYIGVDPEEDDEDEERIQEEAAELELTISEADSDEPTPILTKAEEDSYDPPQEAAK